MSVDHPKVMASLKKYLKPNAVKDSAQDTFRTYLGKNSTSADHEAFLEYLDSEYLANECHKLNDTFAAKIGVYSLLDGMVFSSKGRPPSLNAILDEQAYQEGNTATYDYYLGERRTREEEQEFRQRLAFVKDMFDMLLDELRSQAVAEYMLGPLKDDDSDSEEEDDDDEEEEEEEPEEVNSEEEEEEEPVDSEEEEEETEKPRHHHHHNDHHTSSRKRTRDSRRY